MPHYQPGQLVRIRPLQGYSRLSCGTFVSLGMARNHGKIVRIRSYHTDYRGIRCYSVVNPRTRREYRYNYPESALIGLTIYTRQQP